ncbi:orexin receptor type 2 [Orussus abietinus]|uniref:orexin receptor type 2 n=1 Tax=Orussus abietinus TaxID=222816 RepID=UPI000C715F9C|nr:orexin receptor type 2 [Orussus abietinus]
MKSTQKTLLSCLATVLLALDLVLAANDTLEEYDEDEMDDYRRNNCTNDYCIPDEDYFVLMEEHIFPDSYDWVFITLHSVVFVGGLVGNALVCLAVYRNHSMRTVTNYFIVNLAVADLLVILICLPPTVVWDVTKTWFLGLELCKAVPYLQSAFCRDQPIFSGNMAANNKKEDMSEGRGGAFDKNEKDEKGDGKAQ